MLGTRENIRALPGVNPRPNLAAWKEARRPARTPVARATQPTPEPLTLPAPAIGCVYTIAEVAGVFNCRPATVYGWIARGRAVTGRPVRLRRLRVPKGRIAPGDLAAFLEAVNPGLTVVIAKQM